MKLNFGVLRKTRRSLQSREDYHSNSLWFAEICLRLFVLQHSPGTPIAPSLFRGLRQDQFERVLTGLSACFRKSCFGLPDCRTVQVLAEFRSDLPVNAPTKAILVLQPRSNTKSREFSSGISSLLKFPGNVEDSTDATIPIKRLD